MAEVGTMRGLMLPGSRRVELRDFPVPSPGPGQVLVRIRASGICGSDIRAIYREHLGVGAEAYQGVIAGHEPAGEIVAVGPDMRLRRKGERVVVYHIAGCGQCAECRHGYMIGCHSPLRQAYGWQRDGGHADYLLADEVTCLPLPDELSYVDGCCVACGFGTAYEALLRTGAGGNDDLLVTGLGPVGLAVAMLARAMGVRPIVGLDTSPERLTLARELDLVDEAVDAGEDALRRAVVHTAGRGFGLSIDCSGADAGRRLALEALRDWGRCAFVGEGGNVGIEVSRLLIHRQVTVHGSWVTSLRHMEELLERLVRWQIHPERVVTHRYSLENAAEAYRVADAGTAGKVVLVA
jgi:threonine dehydrogenase-like Zn-dependent dehydrogenase